MPKSDGWFRPGVSGNPGGRPKNAGSIRTLARDAAGKAIYALIVQLHDRRIAPRERRAAAKLLLRIGFGPEHGLTGRVVLQQLGWQGARQALHDAWLADQATGKDHQRNHAGLKIGLM